MSNDNIEYILQSILGSYEKSRNEIIFQCPFHSHHKKKLYVNIKHNMCHCFVCEYSSSIINLLKKINVNKDILSNIYSYYSKNPIINKPIIIDDFKFKDEFKQDNNEYDISQNLNEISRKVNFNSIFPIDRGVIKYLNKRNVYQEDIIKYSLRIGIKSKFNNSIIIPSYNYEGHINFFQSRNIVIRKDIINEFGEIVNIIPTYINCFIKRNEIIFNDIFIDWDEDIYIVEGFFDYVKLNKNCLCLLGSKLNERSASFQKLLKHNRNKYICLDIDAKEKSHEIVDILLKYGCKNVYVLNWDKVRENSLYNNINDIGDIQDRNMIDNFIHLNIDEINIHNKSIISLTNMIDNI